MDILTILNEPSMTLIEILLIIIITTIITRLVAFLMNKMQRFKKDMTAIYLIRDIINYVIYFFALIAILQFFGIDLLGTLLSIGIIGIALSFAAKDIISNLFSGIILIIGKSIKVGDTVEIDGKKGIVQRISLRSTVVVEDLGVKNIVPNSVLTTNEYLLFKPPEKYRVDLTVGLPLEIDVERFKDEIVQKISQYDGISEYPKPDVFSKEIMFKENRVKVSFWIKDFNTKDEYKLKINNDIRKCIINLGEKDE